MRPNGLTHASARPLGQLLPDHRLAAAALTGLQFVVQSLLASNARVTGLDDPASGIEAFGTPTIVHFALALVVSALMCVPWPGYASLRAALATVGASGFGYFGVVLRRARPQRSYVPVAEDWLWHILLPAAAYAAVLLAAMFFAHDVEADGVRDRRGDAGPALRRDPQRVGHGHLPHRPRADRRRRPRPRRDEPASAAEPEMCKHRRN